MKIHLPRQVVQPITFSTRLTVGKPPRGHPGLLHTGSKHAGLQGKEHSKGPLQDKTLFTL